MPTANPPNTTPTRRRALGFTAAAITAGMTAPVLAGAATITPDPDAELIALCAEFDRAEHARIAILRDPTIPDDTATWDRLLGPFEDEQDRLAPKIWETRAQTLEGIRAKAKTLALWAPHFLAEEAEGWDDEFAVSIIRDLVGSAVA